MSATPSTTRATPANKSAKKNQPPKLLVKLLLPSELLATFLPSTPSSKRTPTADYKPEPSPSIHPPEAADKSSDSNSTPAPLAGPDASDPNSLAPPKVDGRKKRGGAAIAGRKRAPPIIDPSAPPRERGRPGPKKKPRLPDGTIDRTTDNRKGPVVAVGNPIPAHKLGPKANTGAINAGLRALDRTGKPCRRWERKGVQLKSFTGATWGLSSWKAPPRENGFPGDVKSDSTGSSDAKPNESSAVASERSNSGMHDVPDLMNGVESSPAPPTAV